MTVAFSNQQPARYRAWEPSFWQTVLMALSMRRFACKYFAQLDLEYESLCSNEYKSARRDEVAELREQNRAKSSWNLNHRFEYLLLAGLPDAILKQRALVHRERLFALVGDEGASVFQEAFPVPAPTCASEEVRTQALGVLMEVQRLRHVQSEFSRLRNRLLLVSVAPGFSFVALALWRASSFPDKPLVASVAIFGLLGAYLSILTRLGSLSWGLKYAVNYQQVDRLFWNLSINFFLSMCQGALGAIVLYFVFGSGVLASPFFPNLSSDRPGAVPTILSMRDVSHRVFSQLMVWSTIAGFSERLIPDLLANLSKDLVVRKKK